MKTIKQPHEWETVYTYGKTKAYKICLICGEKRQIECIENEDN